MGIPGATPGLTAFCRYDFLRRIIFLFALKTAY